MNKIILLTLICFSFVATANVTNLDFNYNATVMENGKFVLNINMKLPKNASIADTFYDMFFNESNLLSMSNELRSSTTNIDMLRALSTYGSSTFVLKSTASKKRVTAQIVSSCNLNVFSSQIKVDCRITNSSTVVGKVFHFGTNSFFCNEKTNYYDCKVTVTGRPVRIAIPFYNRSEERLAVSGIHNTIENYFKTFYHYGLSNEIKNYTKEEYFKKNIKGLWGSMVSYLKDEQELKGKLNISSNSNGFLVFNNQNM